MSRLLAAARAYEALAAGAGPAERRRIARDVMGVLLAAERPPSRGDDGREVGR